MKYIDATTLKKMLQNATYHLQNHKTDIDAMNVFPVPDGDTGTNMSKTFENGLLEVNKVSSNKIYDVTKALSYGLLMGACGNSGVITSQIFRGFHIAVEQKEQLDVMDLSKCFLNGAKIAYKAVMKPVEGTILTVIRLASENANAYLLSNPDISVEEYLKVLKEEAQTALEQTPEFMPLLKEVGVLDSGGYGLTKIIEGFYLSSIGETVSLQNKKQDTENVQANFENEEFGYCTEFILNLNESGKLTFEEEKLKRSLTRIGNSLVVVVDENLVKVHVHTLMPGEVLNIAERYGDFVKIKIENMSIQHEHIIEQESKKDYFLIAVSSGKGLDEYFKSLRVDKIISGGQTMNPSTKDFVDAISNVRAKNIFIFPNNSNIIMAAKQAADILKDKNIQVFETKTIQQGISACLNFNPEADLETNIEMMKDGINNVISGNITYSIRDTEMDNIQIKKDDYIAMKEKSMVASDKNLEIVYQKLIESLYFEDAELLTIYPGEDADSQVTEEIIKYVEDKYHIETEVIEGNQPVYIYLFGIE